MPQERDPADFWEEDADLDEGDPGAGGNPGGADNPGGQEEEEEAGDDLFAGLDEETATRLKAEFDTRVQNQAKQQFDQFRGNYGRRFNQVVNDLQERGLTVDDKGRVAVVDPQKFRQHAVEFALGGGTQQQAKQDEEITLDPYDTQEELTRKANLIAQRAAEKAREEALKEVGELRGVVQQLMGGGVAETVHATLDEYGAGEWTEDPLFEQSFNQHLQTLPLQQQSNPGMIRKVTLWALDDVKLERGGKPQKAAEGERSRTSGIPLSTRGAANGAARSGLGLIGPSQDTGNRKAAEDKYWAERAQVLSEMTGDTVTPAQAKSLASDPTGRAYQETRAREQRGKR
jgi:hypothetical protein